MADVDHHVLAEVPANGSLFSFFRIRWPEHVAHFSDDVVTFENERDHWCRLHEFDDVREERLICDVTVVIGEKLVTEMHHFRSANFEAGILVAIDYVSAVSLGNTVGLEKNE